MSDADDLRTDMDVVLRDDPSRTNVGHLWRLLVRAADRIAELEDMYAKARRLLHGQGYSDHGWLGGGPDV